jgi:hypothetical protein
MSRWPFISRERFDDLKAMMEKRIAELESERQKLWDVLAYNAIHMTIFNKDLIPQPVVEAEPILTEEQKLFEERASIEREEQRRLASVMRTRPSQAGAVMSEIMSARATRAASSAMPVNPAVKAVFDKARSEATH